MNILYIGILLCSIIIYIYTEKRAKKKKNELLNQERLLNLVDKAKNTRTDRYKVREYEDLEDLGDFEFPKELSFKGIFSNISKAEVKEGNIAVVGDREYVCIKGKWIEIGHIMRDDTAAYAR